MMNISTYLDGTLTGTTTLDQSKPGNNSNGRYYKFSKVSG